MRHSNPYAIYVFCDGAMDYNPKNTGGVGYEIVFPDFLNKQSIQESLGRYEGGNIERYELEGLIQGMDAILDLHGEEHLIFRDVQSIIFITDRFRLNDKDGTSPYRIRDWRKNKWHNHEGKPIKNHDLLDKLDKKRKKISDLTYSRVEIEFRPRKQNKTADKLAKKGKSEPLVNDTIAVKGLKVGKRKFDGGEIIYKSLSVNTVLHIYIYLKSPVGDQWEISTEICEGCKIGQKLKIYADDRLAQKLQRGNEYIVRLKAVFKHYVIIYKTLTKHKQKDNI